MKQDQVQYSEDEMDQGNMTDDEVSDNETNRCLIDNKTDIATIPVREASEYETDIFALATEVKKKISQYIK